MANPGFWERLNPVNQVRDRLAALRAHPIQSSISTALGFVNPALGFASKAAFGAYNNRHPQQYQFVRPAFNGTDFGSAGFDNYGATDHGADVGLGYEDYGSIFTGEPNAPDNYVEVPQKKGDGGFRAKEASWSGVMGQGANGETLIRGVSPEMGYRYVYNKSKNRGS